VWLPGLERRPSPSLNTLVMINQLINTCAL
jgi:hypothetical protein